TLDGSSFPRSVRPLKEDHHIPPGFRQAPLRIEQAKLLLFQQLLVIPLIDGRVLEFIEPDPAFFFRGSHRRWVIRTACGIREPRGSPTVPRGGRRGKWKSRIASARQRVEGWLPRRPLRWTPAPVKRDFPFNPTVALPRHVQ